MALALLTNILAYATLLFTPFPVFSQMAVFAIVGITTAALVVFLWFPYLETIAQPTARPKYCVARCSGFAPRLDLQVESATSARSIAARNPDCALAVLSCTVVSLRSVRLVFWSLATLVQEPLIIAWVKISMADTACRRSGGSVGQTRNWVNKDCVLADNA